MSRILCVVGLVGCLSGMCWAGPYPGAAETPASTAIAANDARLVAWANSYGNYQPGTELDLTWQTPGQSLGPATGDVFDIVSLGNGGQITLTFAHPIANGPGFDLAVFENSFSDTFLELAWVEVSADGVNFLRMPNHSLTPNPVAAFGMVDPTDIDGLAGKYRVGYGTPFDLSAVGLSRASYVRIVDIVGDGSALDSSGNVIYDPHRTTGSAGFDLEAVGVLHEWLYTVADANDDGAVNALDVSPFVLALTDPSQYVTQYGHAPEAADINADGHVNALDIAPFVSALVGGQGGAIVPEPAALSVALVAAMAIALRRWSAQVLATLLLSASMATAGPIVVDFEDLSLGGGADHWSGSYPMDGQGGTGVIESFSSQGVSFDTFSDGDWYFWNGFAYSRATDNTTPGYGNQYSSIAGGGFGGSAVYAVGFVGFSLAPQLRLAQPSVLSGAYVTNTTYAYLSLRDGDMFAKPMGDDPATSPRENDYPGWFTLIATGFDAQGQQTGQALLDLADYRVPDGEPASHIVSQWVWMDLSSLGEVGRVEFSVDASDGGWGWPQYFALDNLTVAAVVPEPGTMLAMTTVVLAAVARRSRSGDPPC